MDHGDCSIVDGELEKTGGGVPFWGKRNGRPVVSGFMV